jgi:hypothetical protein
MAPRWSISSFCTAATENHEIGTTSFTSEDDFSSDSSPLVPLMKSLLGDARHRPDGATIEACLGNPSKSGEILDERLGQVMEVDDPPGQLSPSFHSLGLTRSSDMPALDFKGEVKRLKAELEELKKDREESEKAKNAELEELKKAKNAEIEELKKALALATGGK